MTDNGKYIILCDGTPDGFKVPRQLLEINGEKIIKRTIRLLRQNGVTNIIVTSHDKRFDNLGVVRYEPLYNDWDYNKKTGYWLSAFPVELLNGPVTFLFGDVYYSENAIKKIVNTKTTSTLFFCTYENKDNRYIKHHDEPLAFKVDDYIMFKEHIERVKMLKDEGKTCREPITWELYRSLNNIDINTHIMKGNYIVINDESCDIDTLRDIMELNKVLGGNKMIKCEVIKNFTLERFDELKNIQRKGGVDIHGSLVVGDVFECSEGLADYLMGKNLKGEVVVKVIEVVPEEIEEEKPIKVEVNETLYETEDGTKFTMPKFDKPKKKKASKK